MALNTSEINAVAHEYITKKVVDNYFRGRVLLAKLMPKTRKIDGGTKIKVPLIYQGANGGAYEGIGSFDTTLKEMMTAAFFDWRTYCFTCVIADIDADKCKGEAEEVELVQTKLNITETSMRNKLGTDVYASSSAGSLNGLGDLFNATTSTAYGDIAEGDFSEWKVNAYSLSGKTFEEKWLFAARRAARVGDEVPNLWVSSHAVAEAFEMLLTPSRRYQDSKLAAMGFDNVMFGKAPWVGDEKIVYAGDGSDVAYGLNLDHLRFYAHKDKFYKWTKFQKPIGQAANVSEFYFMGNLVTDARRTHVKVTNIPAVA